MADEPKPPYVQFEVRSVEDREATIAAGHYVGRDVIFAIVVPAGTRDRIERVASEWLENIRQGVDQERVPSFWYDAYKRALNDFENSRETPEFGTPVQTWPGATPSQIKLLLDINVRTVEELAAANEETVARIGMGGRALKEKAKQFLEVAADQGKVVEEINALKVENADLRARDAEREQRLQKLETQLAALSGAETPAEEEVE